MGLPIRTKQPSETLLFDMDFQRDIRAGESLSAIVDVTIQNQGRVTGSADITPGTTAVGGTRAQVYIPGGTDLEDYKVTIVCTTSDGETVEGDGLLEVREL